MKQDAADYCGSLLRKRGMRTPLRTNADVPMAAGPTIEFSSTPAPIVHGVQEQPGSSQKTTGETHLDII